MRRELWEPFLIGALGGPALGLVLGYEWWVALLGAVVGGPLALLVAARNAAIRKAFGHSSRYFPGKATESFGEPSTSPRTRVGLGMAAIVAGALGGASVALFASGNPALALALFVVGAGFVGLCIWFALRSPGVGVHDAEDDNNRDE